MALVVEDGTGLSNAESYLSVTDANTYFTNLGTTAWTGTDAVKEAVLRKATQYLDATYSWAGTIASTTQALNWPREGVEDSQGRDLDNTVPRAIENATAELALAALSGDLVEITNNSNYAIREKVGDIEVEYRSGAPIDRQYRYVDRLLNGLYTSTSGYGSTIKLARV